MKLERASEHYLGRLIGVHNSQIATLEEFVNSPDLNSRPSLAQKQCRRRTALVVLIAKRERARSEAEKRASKKVVLPHNLCVF